jgi:sporulation protein YlmC with PRC-barrel domain
VNLGVRFMRFNIKQLYGNNLGASDGEIGRVKDFYFDDQNWAIRYLVADTEAWLPGRQVLISPHAFKSFDPAGKILRLNLTRKQIEKSPSLESHKPVSRQYEEEYYRYFGWPNYWQGEALWGMTEFPVLTLPAKPPASDASLNDRPQPERPDAHLRSAQAVNGYHLQATDWTTGHVSDFMMDDQSWRIDQIVVRTGHRLSGKEVLIPVNTVNRISYDESTVYVNLTKREVEQGSAQT